MAFTQGGGAAVAVGASCRVPVAQMMGGRVDVEIGDVDEDPVVLHVR